MTRSQSPRDVLVALGLTVTTSIGLASATPAAWPTAILIGIASGVLLLLGDILLFDRPTELATRLGRGTAATLLLVAILSAGALAFMERQARTSSGQGYPFLVTNGRGVTTIVKNVPDEDAAGYTLYETGDHVSVGCYVDESDGRWFKLTDEQGWLRDDEVIPSPYSGRGSPPRCPD